MIFIPKKEDCVVWNETDEGIYILYFVDGNERMEMPIRFFWGKTPKVGKNNQTIYTKDYDPFYISVIECMNDEVLNCPLNACSAKPQLRYNKIIDKWYCNCPSGAICTKNDDQSELDELLSLDKVYDKKHGFCNNPVEAILKWNENCAISFRELAKSNMKKYRELMNE